MLQMICDMLYGGKHREGCGNENRILFFMPGGGHGWQLTHDIATAISAGNTVPGSVLWGANVVSVTASSARFTTTNHLIRVILSHS